LRIGQINACTGLETFLASSWESEKKPEGNKEMKQRRKKKMDKYFDGICR
jgi:hypothetical protein